MKNKLNIYKSLGLLTSLLILIYIYKNFKSFNIFDILFNWLDIKSLPLYYYFERFYIAFFKFHFIIFAFIVCCIFLFIIRYIYFEGIKKYDPKIFNSIPNNQSISHFVFSVLKKHPIEFLLLFSIIFTISIIIIRESFSNHDNYLSIVVGFALSTFSILFGMLGMFFAYMAENKSNELLEDRSSFSEGFISFMSKLNYKISLFARTRIIYYSAIPNADSGLEKPCQDEFVNHIDNYSKEFDEKLIRKDSDKKIEAFYHFKFMLLTPFLGHAGLLPKMGDKSLSFQKVFKEYKEFKVNIKSLLDYKNCFVQIIIPPLNEIIEWYGLIRFLDEIKDIKTDGRKKFLPQINQKFQDEIILSTRKYLNEIILSRTIFTSNNEKIDSFVENIDSLKNISLEKSDGLLYSHRRNLPFQCFITTSYENSIKEFSEDDCNSLKNLISKGIHHKSISKKYDVKEDSVIVSMVGSNTFRMVNYNIGDDGDKYNAMGLSDLFSKLHSAFQSKDPRMIKIIDNHFEQCWNKKTESTYPSYEYKKNTDNKMDYIPINDEEFKEILNDEKIEKLLNNYTKIFNNDT